jgi:hypothetical protein
VSSVLRAAAIVLLAALPSAAFAASALVRVSAIVEPHCVVAAGAALHLRCNVANDPGYRFEIRPNGSGEVILSIDP